MKLPARRMLLSCACLVPIAAFGATASAQADTVDTSLCSSAAVSQPFAPWGDTSSYQLVAGGDFESGTWSLSGGAQLVNDSEPFAATGTLGAAAVSLPAGGTATSPLTCLDAAYPSLRMFVGGNGTVMVSAVAGGASIPLGVVHGGGSWVPSQAINTNGAVFGLLKGGSADVSLRLTGLTGAAEVDDVFIDPWQRCC